jgi:hypothetical protein
MTEQLSESCTARFSWVLWAEATIDADVGPDD